MYFSLMTTPLGHHLQNSLRYVIPGVNSNCKQYLSIAFGKCMHSSVSLCRDGKKLKDSAILHMDSAM